MAPNIQYPWLYSNLEIAYPFNPPVYPPYVASIFVDAYIVDGTNLRVGEAAINKPLRLVQFELTDANTAGLMQLQYVDDGSLFFFENTAPTTQYRVWDFGDWKIVCADNAEERKYVRLALYTPNIPAYPFKLSLFIDGLDAVFTARTHEQNLPKVYSIEVLDATTGVTHVLSNDVEFYPGYNMAFSVDSVKVTSESFKHSKNRLLTPVTMSADHGSGLGRMKIPCEEEVEYLKTVNFVPPDDEGNMVFKLDKTLRCSFAYSGTGTMIIRDDGELTLDNDGAACCTCDDYGDAYKKVLALQADAKEAALGADAVRLQHCEIVDAIKDELKCREQPNIKLMLMARSAWIVNVLIIFNNNGKCEKNAPPVTLTFTTAAGAYQLVAGSPNIYVQGIDDVGRNIEISSPTAPGITAEKIPGSCYAILSYEIVFTDEPPRENGQEVKADAVSSWGPATAKTKLIGPTRDPDPEDCADVTDYPPLGV